LVFAGINIQALLEIPGFAIRVDKVTEGCATLLYGNLQAFFAVGDQHITV
jgi:hypothetical protein